MGGLIKHKTIGKELHNDIAAYEYCLYRVCVDRYYK